QGTIDNIYEQFVSVVSRGRSLSEDSVRTLADGRIFTGEQAYALGLVDTLGTLQTAVSVAGTLGKIEGEPRITREMEQESLMDILVGTKTRKSLEHMGTRLQQSSPLEYRLLY
ncbi:MAG: S49 family peptidase, partial [Bacteroidetes bacterium]|nr:S49 family peptidase [Bacteroidota bacterium]